MRGLSAGRSCLSWNPETPATELAIVISKRMAHAHIGVDTEVLFALRRRWAHAGPTSAGNVRRCEAPAVHATAIGMVAAAGHRILGHRIRTE